MPEECIDLYKTASPWNKFQNIHLSSGLESINIDNYFDNDSTVDIRDLNGKILLQKIKYSDINQYLTTGIYIVTGELGFSKKVFIE